MQEFMGEESAHKSSKLSKEAYGVYRILEAFKPPKEQPTTAADKGKGEYASGSDGDTALSRLERVADEIHEVYASDTSAPVGWHLKDTLKKELRGKVRRIVHPLGFPDWKQIPARVEEYALKHYIKT